MLYYPHHRPHFQTLVVRMPLAMLHLRSLRESMLKAAHLIEHLVWRALMNLFFAFSACLVTSTEAMSIVLPLVALAPTHFIHVSVKEPIFQANGA